MTPEEKLNRLLSVITTAKEDCQFLMANVKKGTYNPEAYAFLDGRLSLALTLQGLMEIWEEQ